MPSCLTGPSVAFCADEHRTHSAQTKLKNSLFGRAPMGSISETLEARAFNLALVLLIVATLPEDLLSIARAEQVGGISAEIRPRFHYNQLVEYFA